MSGLFEDIRGYCGNLRENHAGRDAMFQEMENMYLLQWPDEAAISGAATIKVTKDPDPRNATQGALRLLTVTEPKIKVPFDANTADAKQASEAMERAALAMILASGRVGQRPIWYEAALSALLYSEVQILIARTQDLVDRGGKSKAAKARAKRINAMTPYLFYVVNPRGGYPVWDGLGLRSYYRVYDVTVEDYIAEWGEPGEAAVRAAGLSEDEDRLKMVTAHDFWDMSEHCAWLGNADGETYLGKHDLSDIPVVATVTEGTYLFDKPEEQRQPFLVTEYRSGMWSRKCLALTALFTQVANWGLNPMWLHMKGKADSPLPAIRQAGLMQYVQVEPGDQFTPLLNKGLVDPATIQALETAERKSEESTMYKSALGGFLGGGSNYSTHALLSQLGRIPLETHRNMTGWAMAEACRIALDGIREMGGKAKQVYLRGVAQELDPAIVPEFYDIRCELDVALPQDKLQQANVYNQLANKVPDRFLVEDILGIGQYEEMWEELMGEQAAKAYAGAYMQQMMTLFQKTEAMQQQAQAQAQAPQMQPPTQGNPNAMLEAGNATGEGIPPELAAMMAGGGQGPGQMAQPVEAGGGMAGMLGGGA